MGKNKKNKLRVHSQNQITEDDTKSSLISQSIEGTTTDTVRPGNLSRHSNKQKRKNNNEIIPEDEKYDPQELDAFCDDLDEEANSTFNNWVSLLEAQLCGKNMVNRKLSAVEQSEDPEMVSGRKQKKKDKDTKKTCDEETVDQEHDRTSILVESKKKRKKNKEKQDGLTTADSVPSVLDHRPKKKKTKFL